MAGGRVLPASGAENDDECVVAMINGGLDVVEAPIPQPGPGEVLVKTLAAGICGSDLHALAHGAELIAGVKEAVAGVEIFKLDEPVVMGHEFCAEVVELQVPADHPVRRRDAVDLDRKDPEARAQLTSREVSRNSRVRASSPGFRLPRL